MKTTSEKLSFQDLRFTSHDQHQIDMKYVEMFCCWDSQKAWKMTDSWACGCEKLVVADPRSKAQQTIQITKCFTVEVQNWLGYSGRLFHVNAALHSHCWIWRQFCGSFTSFSVLVFFFYSFFMTTCCLSWWIEFTSILKRPEGSLSSLWRSHEEKPAPSRGLSRN